MAGPWLSVEVDVTFTDLLDKRYAELEKDIIQYGTPPVNVTLSKYSYIEIQEILSFTAEWKACIHTVCNLNDSPRRAGLSELTDATGRIPNFYEKVEHSWHGYCHIDFRFRLFTSVLVHHASSPSPQHLRKMLTAILENFRASP